MKTLSPEVLKARLAIATGLFEPGGIEAFMAWTEAAEVTPEAGDAMLVEAILQALGDDDALVSPLLVMTFRDRLLEASNGLAAASSDVATLFGHTRQVQQAALHSSVLKVRGRKA